MAYLKTRDQEFIHYSDAGRGDAVILIHGWPANADMFEYQTTTLLERGYRVIAYDRRGFGRSSRPANNYNYDTFASDLNELIRHLDLTKVALIGFSMGGGEIARYLSTYGADKISKAILISSVVPYMMKTDSNPKGVPHEKFEEMIQALREDRPHFLAGFAKDFYGVNMISSPVSKEILDWMAFMTYQASPKATIDCVTAFGTTDFRQDLKAFTIPTLLIHGTDDKIVPIEPSSETALKLISGAHLKRYDGAPHGLFVTHKKELTEDIISFLGKSAVTAPFIATETVVAPEAHH